MGSGWGVGLGRRGGRVGTGLRQQRGSLSHSSCLFIGSGSFRQRQIPHQAVAPGPPRSHCLPAGMLPEYHRKMRLPFLAMVQGTGGAPLVKFCGSRKGGEREVGPPGSDGIGPKVGLICWAEAGGLRQGRGAG